MENTTKMTRKNHQEDTRKNQNSEITHRQSMSASAPQNHTSQLYLPCLAFPATQLSYNCIIFTHRFVQESRKQVGEHHGLPLLDRRLASVVEVVA